MKFSLRNNFIIALAVFVSFVVLDSIGLSKTGMLWDELAVATNGETYIGYFKNLNFSQRNWSLNDEHPPLGKYIYGVARKITKASSFLTRLDPLYPESRSLTFSRFFSVLMGGISLAVLFLMSTKYFGRGVGLLAVLFLGTNPHFLAYTRIACLEMPILMFSLLFVWAFLTALNRDTPKTGYSRFGSIPTWVVVGVLLGAALASRFNGVFLCFLYETGLLLFYKKDLFTKKHIWKVFISALSLIFLYIIWPWLWQDPVRNFLESIDRGLEVHIKEYFLGRYSFNTPFYYFIYFLATVPLLQLFFFAFEILGRFFRVKGKPLKRDSFLIIFLFLYFLTPFLASFVPLKQDGIRYVQFYLPAFAILSALGFYNLILRVRNYSTLRVGIIIGVVLCSLYIPFRFYPYYMDYYNKLFGSLQKIAQNKTFEMGWWGEGSLEAVGKVNSIAKPGERVFVDFAPGHTVPSFLEGIRTIRNRGADPDYIILNLFAKWYGDGDKTESYIKEQNYKLIYEVKVADKVTIVWVYGK